MKYLINKTSAFGSRYNMYRLQFAAYSWNPTVKAWEVYQLDSDGSIQDLCGFYSSRNEAEIYANKVNITSIVK